MAEIMIRINNGEGTIGRLIQDSVISENINQMIINLRKTSKGLNENMEAAKSNILLRGYFNKKARQARQDSIENAKRKEEQEKRKE
jgi:phospholipid/cholesterol/gamma-HCH transport system substrate-binding protein